MESTKKKILVFCDFDGTITLSDLGDKVFEHFGKIEPYNTMLKNKEISIIKYWHLLCQSLDKELKLSDIAEYALNFEIDEYFIKFADYCKNNGIELTILSDGFDIYIDAILKKYNIEHIKYFSNKLKEKDNNIFPIFDFASDGCNCFCASCKRNRMIHSTDSDAIYVYIGDGYSDFCAAEHSDIIFAKKNLAKFCNENKISHYPFKSFYNILQIFENLFDSNKVKVKHQAWLKRNKAFQYE